MMRAHRGSLPGYNPTSKSVVNLNDITIPAAEEARAGRNYLPSQSSTVLAGWADTNGEKSDSSASFFCKRTSLITPLLHSLENRRSVSNMLIQENRLKQPLAPTQNHIKSIQIYQKKIKQNLS